MPKAKKTGYQVGNPNRLPAGVPIISFAQTHWREGDAFEKPKDMPDSAVEAWVAKGFLVLVE